MKHIIRYLFVCVSIGTHLPAQCSEKGNNTAPIKLIPRAEYFKDVNPIIFENDDIIGNPMVVCTWNPNANQYEVTGISNDEYNSSYGTIGDINTLTHALFFKAEHLVEILLKYDTININAWDDDDETPLEVACRTGNASTVQSLLHHNAWVHNPPNHTRRHILGQTISRTTSPKILRILLANTEVNPYERGRLVQKAQTCLENYQRLFGEKSSRKWKNKMDMAQTILRIISGKDGKEELRVWKAAPVKKIPKKPTVNGKTSIKLSGTQLKKRQWQ